MAVTLTARQEQVLRLVGDGHTTQQVADTLGISRNTAYEHILVLRANLGAQKRRELIPIARKYFNGKEGT